MRRDNNRRTPTDTKAEENRLEVGTLGQPRHCQTVGQMSLEWKLWAVEKYTRASSCFFPLQFSFNNHTIIVWYLVGCCLASVVVVLYYQVNFSAVNWHQQPLFFLLQYIQQGTNLPPYHSQWARLHTLLSKVCMYISHICTSISTVYYFEYWEP